MTSEIRVNKINNRAGLGTVEYTPTGIIVSGIVTAYEFDGNFDTTPGIVITGIGTAQSLDVDDFVDVGNIIKLGNAGVVTATTFSTANVDVTTDKIVVGTGVTIEANQVATGQATFTGIVTASSFSGDGSGLTGIDATKIITGNTQVQTIDTGSDGHIKFTTEGSERARIIANGNIGIGEDAPVAKVHIAGSNYASVGGGGFDSGVVLAITRNNTLSQTAGLALNSGTNGASFIHLGDADDPDIGKITYDHVANSMKFAANTTERLEINNTGVNITGIVTATSFSGDGSSLSNLPAGAPVGGASTNTVFFENDKAVAVNYQVTSTKNAMSAGPIAINAGIAVTVPSGCAWTIV